METKKTTFLGCEPEERIKQFTEKLDFVKAIKPKYNLALVRIAKDFENTFYKLASGIELITTWKPDEYAHVDGELLAVGDLRYKPLKRENLQEDHSLPLEYNVDQVVVKPGDRVFLLNTAISEAIGKGLFWHIEGGGFAALVRYDMILGACRDGETFGVNGSILMKKIQAVGHKTENGIVVLDKQTYYDVYKVAALPRDRVLEYAWNPAAGADREGYIRVGQQILVETCWPLMNTFVKDESFDYVVCRQEHVAGIVVKNNVILNNKRVLYQPIVRKITGADGLIATTEMGGRYLRGVIINAGPDTQCMDTTPKNKADWRLRLVKRGDEIVIPKGTRGMQYGKNAMIIHEKDLRVICRADQIVT